MFALQNAPREALELSGLEVTRWLLPSSTTRFDLELHLWAQGDGWSGSLIYSRDLFEEASIEAMVRHYVALLEGMLEEPERAVSLCADDGGGRAEADFGAVECDKGRLSA